MKPIYILALHNVRTGGPEAIHQLSDALIEQGFDASMVYYDFAQIAAMERAGRNEKGYRFGDRANTIEDYAHYKVNAVECAPNAPGNVIVLPETLCHLAPFFSNATVLIWWLSVDNAFGSLAKVNLNHLRKPGVQHAAQSLYADKFIRALKFRAPMSLLTDYTVDLSAGVSPLPWGERLPLVLFNANHKVTADLECVFHDVIALDISLTCTALRHMPRASLAELMARAKLYVDLGCMPGKDRMPREALLMGCNVVTFAHYGAGAEFAAPMSYSMDDVAETIVHEAKRDNLQFLEKSVRYIQEERTHFFKEVRDVFSEL